jgi:hypothetical protein
MRDTDTDPVLYSDDVAGRRTSDEKGQGGVCGRTVSSFNGAVLSCDPSACGDVLVSAACSGIPGFRLAYELLLHSKSCGGGGDGGCPVLCTRGDE